VDNQGLGGVVVAGGEIDGILAFRSDRELLDVHVEVLGARGDGGIEGGAGPLDLVLAEAHLLGDRVGDGGLIALAALGIVVFDVGRVCGIPRGDGQGTGIDGLFGDGSRLGVVLGRGRAGTAGRSRHQGSEGECCDHEPGRCLPGEEGHVWIAP